MSKKNEQTHGLKKVSGAIPTAELLPAPADESILFGPAGSTTARVDYFEKITSLNEPALRHMASEGFFPAFIRRRGHIEQTLRGVIRCLIERLARRSEKTLPVLASMEQSEGAGIFSKKFLQMLKSAGLPGFPDSNRIDLAALLPGIEAWLSGDNQRDKHELQLHGVANWDQYRAKFQALNEKIEYDKNATAVMDYAQALALGQSAQTIYFASLDRLAVDLPGRLAGRSPAEIKTALDAALHKIRDTVRDEFATRHRTALQQHATQTAATQGKELTVTNGEKIPVVKVK